MFVFNFKNANNAVVGMTLQKMICDKYHLNIHKNAIKQFESAYDKKLEKDLEPIIKNIFNDLDLKPLKCLTFSPSKSAKETFCPHNFLLNNGSTLSIRTNKKSDKVAPRVVGQCGLEKFNEHFSSIAGYEIEDKQQIKKIIFEYIHLMLPIFIDYLLISDITIWVYDKENKLQYEIINSNKVLDLDLERTNFTFTKSLSDWNESTTLKYKGLSLAEIQIHKNRTFKFRFIMSSLISLLEEEKITTETLGITAEKTICDLYGLEYPKSFDDRFNEKMEKELVFPIKEAFDRLPKPIKHTGSEPGERGKESKCPYDFILDGNLKLSLKTNTGKMVCPPEVGQPGAETCYSYFKDFISEDHIDSEIYKKMILGKISEVFPIFINHLFDSDFLLWVRKRNDNFIYSIYKKNYGDSFKWDKDKFSFTKTTVVEWNESNTLKYDGISIGEFQVHKTRDCFKFRFNLENFAKIIEKFEK